MNKRWWAGAWLLGVLSGVVLLEAWAAWRYLTFMPNPSSSATALPLTLLQQAPATVSAGTPRFRAAPYAESANGATASGIWASDGPATFEWRFGSDEVVYVLEGQVEVDYLGNQFSLVPGDTAMFLQGTRAVWHVPKHVKKSYKLFNPNALVRLWRRWVQPPQAAPAGASTGS